MLRKALYVRLEAKPGKEAAVADFLRNGLPLAQQEPGTIMWFALQMGPATFGIFDCFSDDLGRQSHLAGRMAQALMAKAADLFSQPPAIEKADILAAKFPE